MRCHFCLEVKTVDILQKAALEYSKICTHKYHYTLSNGEKILVEFKPQNFVHLAGLRKLNDLYEFQQQFSATNIYKKILRGDIGIYDIQQSVHFDTDAKERVENLCRLDYLLQTKLAVWGFDHKKTHVRTRLKSSVIFFRDDGYNFYLMLGVAKNEKTYYPETFFLRFDAAYIHGQEIVTVENLEIE